MRDQTKRPLATLRGGERLPTCRQTSICSNKFRVLHKNSPPDFNAPPQSLLHVQAEEAANMKTCWSLLHEPRLYDITALL